MRLIYTAKILPKKILARSVVTVIGSYMIRRGLNKPVIVRDKPHVLILRHKFYSKGKDQPSTEVIHLDNTLISSGLATFDVLTCDHDLFISPLSDLQLIAKCLEVKPDAIILSSWGLAPRHPSIHSLKLIRKKLGIPIAAIWWDTCSKSFWSSLESVKTEFDVHVIMDNPNLYYIDQEDQLFERVLQLWPPQDENLYKPNVERDIPVSFQGQVSSYRSYRTEVIEYLTQMKVLGHFSTSDRHKQVTHAAYADLMGRSRMSINFSYSVSCHQLKSRVLEIMFSGAMLLESENEQTSKLFEPMKDYVPFSSKEDLEQKIRYYLNHEDEMTTIAAHGRATAIKHYSSNRFWRLLLKKLELIELE
jgi:hypothetical protein